MNSTRKRIEELEDRVGSIGRVLTSHATTIIKLEDWYNGIVKASNAKVRMSWTDEEIDCKPKNVVKLDDSVLVVVSDHEWLPLHEIKRRLADLEAERQENKRLRERVLHLERVVHEKDSYIAHAQANLKQGADL